MSPSRAFFYNPPKKPFLTVLYQDDNLIVIDKPSGLLSVPGRDPACIDSVIFRIRQLFSDQAQAVHRLDMDTSGLMVAALNKKTASALGKAFEQRLVVKEYVALAAGKLEGRGVIDLPLRCDIQRRPLQIVDLKLGKPALTEYVSLETIKVTTACRYVSRLLLIPKTGRSHQLRVHLQSIDHPLLGDRFYGGNREVIDAFKRLCLHACTLEFKHPFSGEWLRFHSPADF